MSRDYFPLANISSQAVNIYKSVHASLNVCVCVCVCVFFFFHVVWSFLPFSFRFWPWLLKTSASIPWKYASLLCDGIMKHQAGFLACLCNDVVPSRYVLNMFCFPQQLRSLVNSDISSTYCVNMQGEGTSKKPLSSGDETCVSLSNGFEVQGAGNVEDIVLK